ncbi:hypothetical protein [Candidatus Thioglobus sp.]|jgi:uncharacterized protein (DUF302 family)|uniref:hypothetical protein n=1 Tax=Candidatus Thioglobus sp. TaxID=2026721 RepID=UPI001D24E860|nr:hypothetical protein [Candidatus Thioglobus sp.]MBT3276401.1 hypothetical protein [Candidatus Thioglobus sp.]MBT3446871.1 hypothetical protein [Candidatus Thioglobus sp.]MBT3744514.1 hypothetical protein [Candidatus Thioglobus sp.]MBT4000685.1 hypothetical protein [Candidatus Thioglobus sp.]MBT4422384.1 hypothetical protein [Candidatus Thioglobus sp.]
MNSTKKILITFFICFATTHTLANTLVSSVTNNSYEDVRDNLVDAIEEKALNISKIYHASDMLNRTKDSISNAKEIYHQAEIIEFCSASISHQLVLANHLNISACPFKIALYTLSNNSKQTHLVYTKLKPLDQQSEAPTIKANKLIQSLIENATW